MIQKPEDLPESQTLIDFLVDWEKGEIMPAIRQCRASLCPRFPRGSRGFFYRWDAPRPAKKRKANAMSNLKTLLRFLCCIAVCGAAVPVEARLDLHYARGFRVDYFDAYKVVTVTRPDAEEPLRYLLIPRGQAPPDGYDGVPRIEIPVRTLIATSTTHLPHVEKLGELDRLIAIDDIQYVHSEAVNRRFATGELTEIGRGASVDLEKILVLQPDLVIADAHANAHLALQQAGIPVIINAAYAEPSLLGRAEWIKLIAAFFGKEERASAQFDRLVVRYEARSALTRHLPADARPSVFVGSLWRGTWFMSGGKTYAAQLLKDAGANYLWADDDSQRSLSLDFEAVYERAHAADCWITMQNAWRSRSDVVAADERYKKFAVFKTGQIFNANARLNKYGGNDYWETGLLEPDVLLADIIKILHPNLLPDHQLKYYRKLDP